MVSRLSKFNSLKKALFCYINKLLIFQHSFANDKSSSGVTIITVKNSSDINAHDIAVKCVENGLLIITAKNLLRMLPPLNISYSEIDEAVEILNTTIQEDK